MCVRVRFFRIPQIVNDLCCCRNTFYGFDTKTNLLVVSRHRSKVRNTGIDIGLKECKSCIFQVRQKQLQFFRRITQLRREIFAREIVFKKCRIVGDDTVCCCMAFIECIRSECKQTNPELLHISGFTALLNHAGHKFIFCGLDFIKVFLGHGSAYHISLTKTKPDKLEQPHDLFLINSAAIGLAKNLFHLRNDIVRLLRSVLDFCDFRNRIHRTGAVCGIHKNHIVNRSRIESRKCFLNAVAFELENAIRTTTGIDISYDIWVIRFIDIVKMNSNLFGRLDVFESKVQNIQVFKAEEVHFKQSEGFLTLDHVAFNDPAILFVVPEQGSIFRDRFICDDDTSGVNTSLNGDTFYKHGIVQQMLYRKIVFVLCRKVRIFFHCLLDGHFRLCRNHFRYHVGSI